MGFAGFAAALGIMPVIGTAYMCHFNIHEIGRELQGYSETRMYRVVRYSVVACTAVYVTVGVSAYVMFGEETQADVLSNITASTLSGLLGGGGGGFSNTLKVMYTVSLVVTFPLINWALRNNILALMPSVQAEVGGWLWLVVTYVILACQIALAIAIPSIWLVIHLSGATAGVLIGYFLPAALYFKLNRDLRLAKADGVGGVGWRVLGATLGVGLLGALVLAMGLWSACQSLWLEKGDAAHE